MSSRKLKQGYKLVKTLFGKELEIPEHWEKSTIGTNSSIQLGFPFSSSEYSKDEKDIKLLRGDNVTEGHLRWGKKTRYWKDKDLFEKYQLKENDFVISMDGSKVGKNYAYVRKEDLPCLLLQRVACLRAKPTLIQEYYGHIFSNITFVNYVNSIKTNSAIPHISSDDIQNFEVLLPSKTEQKKIASILNSIDELIDNYDAIIDSTKMLKMGMIQQLFTKGLGHKEFKKVKWMFGKEIEIPKEWTIQKLNDICDKIVDGPHISPKYMNSGIPFLTVNNIIHGKIDLTNAKYISKKDHEKYSKRAYPKKEDILYTKGGTTGFAKIVDVDFEFSIWVHLALLKLISSQINSKFLEFFLNSKLGTIQAKFYTYGVGNQDLVLGRMGKILVIVPPLEEQQRISSILSPVDSKINELKSKKNELEKLKKGLMQKILTGQIRVKV